PRGARRPRRDRRALLQHRLPARRPHDDDRSRRRRHDLVHRRPQRRDGSRAGAVLRKHHDPGARARQRRLAARRRAAAFAARAHRLRAGARDRGERRQRVPRCDGGLARRRRAVLRFESRDRAPRRGTHGRARVLRAGDRALSVGRAARRSSHRAGPQDRRRHGDRGMIAHALAGPQERAKQDRIRADFPILATRTSRGKPLTYLDSAATSQKPQAVIDALVDYYTNYNANIHRGVYEIAARATDAFEDARAAVARFVNAAEPAEIIWTRNTTESINLVSYTWGLENLRAGDAILTTEVEHHSDLVPWQLLAKKTGAELRFIPAAADGTLLLDDLDALLRGTKLVAISHVSNTLGSIAPLATIIPRAHAAGAVVLVDGAQSAPHMPVDVRALDVDFFAASG